jgi:hypothetical protein
MSYKVLLKVLLLIAAVLSLPLLAKLGWDEYQQRLAEKQIPNVESIFRNIQQIPGAEATGELTISVNEYSAALWQSYKADIECSELRPHFDSEVLRQGFKFSRDYAHGPSVE